MMTTTATSSTPFGGSGMAVGQGAATASVCMAAWSSNLKVLQGLVDQVQQQQQQLMGYGPLHFAASLGDVAIINFLLDNAMDDKDARDKDGNSPLMWVVAYDNRDDAADEELMEALVDHGADVNIQNFAGETALFIAAQRGFLAKVDYLLENGANVHVKNLDGASALHVAAAGGHEEVAASLVRYGAHLNDRDDEGDTPLHWAVREASYDAVTVLVQSGADVNAPNVDDETPLAIALCCDDKDMAACLAGAYSAANAQAQGYLPPLVSSSASAYQVTHEMGKLSFPATANDKQLYHDAAQSGNANPFAAPLAGVF